MTYLLVPEEGVHPSVVDEHATTQNSHIVEYSGTRYLNRYESTPGVLAALDPMRPRDYMQKEIIISGEGEQKAWTPLPEGKLGTGENPFIQLIYRTVMMAGASDFDDIIQSLAQNYRVMTINSWTISKVRDLIAEMNERALLLIKDGKYQIGLRFDYVGLVDFKEGYDPRFYQVSKLIQANTTASYKQIHERLFVELQWTDEEKNIRKLIKAWVKLGYIEEDAPGWYRLKNMPEPIAGEA